MQGPPPRALSPLLPNMEDHCIGTSDIFKLVYYEACTVGKFCCVSLHGFGLSLVSDQIVQLLSQVMCLDPLRFPELAELSETNQTVSFCKE